MKKAEIHSAASMYHIDNKQSMHQYQQSIFIISR